MKNFFKARFAPVIGAIALMAVVGFSMAACGGGGDDVYYDPGFTSDLSGKTVQLNNDDAKREGQERGLKAYFKDPAMMQGKKVTKGDKFKLNITFKLDKTLDEDMWIVMIDNTPAANYWTNLTSGYGISKEELVANTEIKKEFILKAEETATSNDAKANTLVFMCDDLGSKSPVTMTFVKFTFTKLAADAEDDYIRIKSVTPSTGLTEMTFPEKQEFTVKVDYSLVSYEQGKIIFLFNAAAPDRWGWSDDNEFTVNKGKGSRTFTVRETPRNWAPNGEFGVQAILIHITSENEDGGTFDLLAESGIKNLSFQ